MSSLAASAVKQSSGVEDTAGQISMRNRASPCSGVRSSDGYRRAEECRSESLGKDSASQLLGVTMTGDRAQVLEWLDGMGILAMSEESGAAKTTMLQLDELGIVWEDSEQPTPPLFLTRAA